jgi:starch-binding outer membrane protein, SusD/RagB family
MRLLNAAARTRARRRPLLGIVVALVLTAPGAACDSLLDVDLPSRLPAGALDDPAMAPTLVLSAIADFECALANYISATGMLTDELIGSTGWIAPTEWDERRIFPNNGNLGSASCTALGWGIFRPLSTAYFTARDAGRRIGGLTDEQVPSRTRLLAQSAAYGAYALTLLGEAFCEVAVELGPLMRPTETLTRAEQEFTEAMQLAQQAGDAETLNMTRVGRARVRLDLGKKAEAAADARLVPENFVQVATRSGTSERRWNRVAVDFHENFYIAVDPRYRDLKIAGVPDSRVEVIDAGRNGHDGLTRSYLATKYMTNGDPLPIASWDEAQLIIAEAEDGQEAVAAINRLRSKAELPLFSGSDPAAIAAQITEERRRELYLEGHRLNDVLRLDLPWDQGATHKGVPFGPTTCLPLPDVERRNNPNIGSG